MTRSARRIAAAFSFIAVLLLTACASGGSNESSSNSNGSSNQASGMRTLRYGISGNLSIYWHVYVGQKQGVFAKHKISLDVATTQTGSASDLLALLVAGQVDMADVLPDSVVAASANSAKLKVLNLTASGVYTLVSRKGISSFDNLKKLSRVKAAVSSASTATAGLSKLLLENAGIPADKIDLVVTGGTSARLAAVSSNAVDVALLVQPADFKAQAGGMTILADSVKSAPWYGLIDTVMADSVKKNCSLYRDFFAAMADIHAFLIDPANKQKAIDALVTSKVSSAADAAKTYDLYVKDNAMPGVNDPTKTLQETDTLLGSLGTKILDNPSSVVDTSCVS